MKTASASGTCEGSTERASGVASVSLGTTSTASNPMGGSKRSTCVPSQMTNPPFSAAATLSGWPSSSAATLSTSASSSNRWSAASNPATIAAALEPSPADSGMSDEILNSNPSAGCRRSNALTTRLSRSRGTASRVSTANVPVSCTSSSRWSERAAARTSNPGPRFAEDAGTRTRRRRRSVIRVPPPRAPGAPARRRSRGPPARAPAADPSGRDR